MSTIAMHWFKLTMPMLLVFLKWPRSWPRSYAHRYKKELLALVIIISMWSYKTDGISIIFKMMLKFEDSFVWISESSFRLSLWQLLSKLEFAKTYLTFLEVNIIRDLENSNHSRWFSELQQSKILITFLFRTSCFKTGFPVNLQRTIYSSDKNNRRL